MPNAIKALHQLGQSVWCDYLSRPMIDSGALERLIDQGVVGVTSNPTIFMKSITGGSDYDDLFRALLGTCRDPRELYEGLVLPDIADAADLLRPVYDRTLGADGFVSLEVNPQLAHDTRATIAEAERLFGDLGRPNVLIKVPATEEGIPAIEHLIGSGINVNVTLIFSIEMYEKVMQAYLSGLQRLHSVVGDLSRVASVASFFVSRVDTLVDGMLEERRKAGADVAPLLGRAGVANAKLAYRRFEEVFAPNGSYGELASFGARVQRPLWASTSTKNPAYPDTLYVDNLVGPHTVNTMPTQTLEAVLDHGVAATTIHDRVEEADELIDQLAELGIDMTEVTDTLLTEGVKIFTDSFEQLLSNLSAKQHAIAQTI